MFLELCFVSFVLSNIWDNLTEGTVLAGKCAQVLVS